MPHRLLNMLLHRTISLTKIQAYASSQDSIKRKEYHARQVSQLKSTLQTHDTHQIASP